MLEHVLAAVRAAPLAGVLILSPDGEPLPQATHVLRDRGTGLNAALELAAAGAAGARSDAAADRVRGPAALACEDLVALERATEASGVALAPDHTGTGTNALGLALPTAFRLQFGAGSCARHQLEAARIGRPATLVRRPGLAFDVDEPADLEALRAARGPALRVPQLARRQQRVEGDRQAPHAAQHRGGLRHRALRQAQARQPCQQQLERGGELRLRQMHPEAEVRHAPEGHEALRMARQFKALRFRVLRGIAPGGTHAEQHPGVGRDVDAADVARRSPCSAAAARPRRRAARSPPPHRGNEPRLARRRACSAASPSTAFIMLPRVR